MPSPPEKETITYQLTLAANESLGGPVPPGTRTAI